MKTNTRYSFVFLAILGACGLFFLVRATPTADATSSIIGTPNPDLSNDMGVTAELIGTPQPSTEIPTHFASPLYAPSINAAIQFVTSKHEGTEDTLTLYDVRQIDLIRLKQAYSLITLIDTRPYGRSYTILVDPTTLAATDRIADILTAETMLQIEQAGTLDPNLEAVLEGRNELVQIVIWLKSRPLAEIASDIDAQVSQELTEYQYYSTFDIDTQKTLVSIRQRRIELLQEAHESATSMWVERIIEAGFEASALPGMPCIVTELPAEVIKTFRDHPDISRIYLADQEVKPELTISTRTAYANSVWPTGLTGNGVTIAIIDTENVDLSHPFLHTIPSFRVAVNGVGDHATGTAYTAAGDKPLFSGFAPEASILSVGIDSTPGDLVAGLIWAIQNEADVINVSVGAPSSSPEVTWLDRAFDYWARYAEVLIVKSAGNNTTLISSPGYAWNVLTVGGYEASFTADWSDDQMWSGSAYRNPPFHREKPELVAVSHQISPTGITVSGVGDTPYTGGGTSLSAPQVSGTAALLLEANPELSTHPEAIRAILMAAATHNIEGVNHILTIAGQDFRDGAGGLRADLAVTIASTEGDASVPTLVSCWWGFDIYNYTFPVNSAIGRYFHAKAGDRVRVVISWNSNADSPTNGYTFDRLDTDLNLAIHGPSGTLVPNTYRASLDNNYEMVDFIAYESGTHEITIFKAAALNGETANSLGVAVLIIPGPHRVFLPTVTRD